MNSRVRIDYERNEKYYQSEQIEPCDCDVCRNYYHKVKDRYPDINQYLKTLDIDIQKPLELIWYESTGRTRIEYVGCQYVAFGFCDGSFTEIVDGIEVVFNVNSHPGTGINEEHFVIDFGTVVLDV